MHKEYGPQGWWPLIGHAGTNPTKSGAVQGYHVGDYTFPRNRNERFEICIGAILTQNTNWPAVEKSLLKLKELDSLTPEKIFAMDEEKLKEAIRSSGYHNQKSRYLKNFALFFQNLGDNVPGRTELLSLLGVGPETADSMLLYAYKQPEFVIDAYTKRIFSTLGLTDEKAKYEAVKSMFENSLRKVVAEADLLVVFQEYHALIVEHAKRYYNKKTYGENCWLKKIL